MTHHNRLTDEERARLVLAEPLKAGEILVALFTAEEVPEAPDCRACEPIQWRGSTWYEPCEDHQPRENND